MNRVLAAITALIFVGMALEAIKARRVRLGLRGKVFGPWTFRRDRQPFAYWATVTFYFLVVVFLAFAAINGRI